MHLDCQALKTEFEESTFILCSSDFCPDIALEGELAEGMENSLEVRANPQFPESQKLHQKENTVIIVTLKAGKRPRCSF